MMLQLLFFLTMYPVLFILYFVMRGAGQGKDGMCFGVRMKAEWRADDEVTEAMAAYGSQLKKMTAVLAVIPLVTFFIPYFSISFTVWMIWILAAIAAPMIPYARGYKRVRARKREKNWGKSGGGPAYTEMKNAGKVRCVKPGPFLVPIVSGGMAAAAGMYHFMRCDLAEIGCMAVTFAVLTVFLYRIAVWMDRQKVEVISSDSEVNLNYARAKKKLWKNMWLILAWFNTIFLIFLMVVMELQYMSAVMWGSILYTLATLALMLSVWKRIAETDQHYRERRELSVDGDDDDNWIWGFCYYNKNDKHIMVNRRIGIGTTMNLATPVGMGLTVFGIAALAVIPVMCIWIIMEEFTPIRLAVADGTLRAGHIRLEYEIPLSDIDEIELIDEKPKWSKVNGTGMENLSKGTFHIRNVGRCEALLNPQNEIFLRIQTEEETYYMSDADDAGTQRIYDQIAAEGRSAAE